MSRARRCAPLLALVLTAGCASQSTESAAADRPPGSADTVEPIGSPTPSPRPSQTPDPTPGPVVVPVGDGRLEVVPGRSDAVGGGGLRTYVVEAEGGLGVDVTAFALAVEQTLADPRSWASGGRRAVQRVDGDDADEADVRVALASPQTADGLCAPLRTNGRYSCANGDRAVINAARWQTGASAYEGELEAYRDYLVNHEVGHVLGFGHVDCPAAGAVAPVMLQQTIGLQGCLPGAWPYP